MYVHSQSFYKMDAMRWSFQETLVPPPSDQLAHSLQTADNPVSYTHLDVYKRQQEAEEVPLLRV